MPETQKLLKMRQILGAEECGRRRTSVRRRPNDEGNDVDGVF